jgi:ABC-2 type transport system ATP-binding protein
MNSSQNKMITVENLVKRYKKSNTNAVDAISFEVNEGEFFAFLGPNGAGKTTTISILTTTLAKTSGVISIAGFDLDEQGNEVRQNIGIIFQKPSLDLNLTAEENIRLHVSLYGLFGFRPFYSMMPKEYKQRIQKLTEIIGLGKEIFKPMKTFSGGMKRKLEIIRSLMHRPKILFLDEPSTGLDPISRHDLWSYLQEVRREDGTTIFLTTHYLDEAEEADRVCIINHGKIITLGTPAQIKKHLIDEYLLLDATDRFALRSELKNLGLQFEEQPQFKVHFNGYSIQDIIKKIETPLTVFEINKPTLEEAYINLIGKNEDAI